MTGLEAVLLVLAVQWAVLGPLVALKYVFNNNNNTNNNSNGASAREGGRVHGRN